MLTMSFWLLNVFMLATAAYDKYLLAQYLSQICNGSTKRCTQVYTVQVTVPLINKTFYVRRIMPEQNPI